MILHTGGFACGAILTRSRFRRFLTAGNKIKVSIRFRGREMTHTDLGLTIMAQFAEKCGDIASVEKPAKLEGRQMLMFLAPKSAK